jgi:D-alanyl-D-alanine dipeptidase
MTKKLVTLCGITLASLFCASESLALPAGFVYLSEVDATIIQDMKYFTRDNFIGRPIKGYQAGSCILTVDAAMALAKVQQQLLPQHLSLKVYDCYRPEVAVNDFVVWSKDIKNQKMKAQYYPRVNKADFFKLGYVAEKSGHTRGSTVDLTVVKLNNKNRPSAELVMGTHYDFMDERSHALNSAIKGQSKQNRKLLINAMETAGFVHYENEWCHITLKSEVFPETYFNFPVA